MGRPGVVNVEVYRANNSEQFNVINSYTGTTAVDNTQGTGFARLIMNGLHTGGGPTPSTVMPPTADRQAALGGGGTISASSMTFGTRGWLSPGGALSADLSDSATFRDTAAIPTPNNNVLMTNGTVDVQLNGTGGGPLQIESGATLTGGGIIGSPTTLDEGATLAPGNSFGTLTFCDALDLNEASVLQFELGTVRDQVVVNGALTLAGTLNVAAVAGFGAGTYTRFNCRPEVGLSLGAVALGNVPADDQHLLSTNSPGQVDLIVSLPTPPSFAAPMISGGNLILGGTGGTPGVNYYMLTATNLTGVWTPLATNQFDGSGNFSFTNTMNPGTAQQFFRLQVP